jgi:hypothetical protein
LYPHWGWNNSFLYCRHQSGKLLVLRHCHSEGHIPLWGGARNSPSPPICDCAWETNTTIHLFYLFIYF